MLVSKQSEYMKTHAAFFCLLVLTVSFFSRVSAQLTDVPSIAEIAESASQSVVMIIVYDVTGAEKGQGSGFFIDSSGAILTNAHVLKNAYSAEVFSRAGYFANVTVLSIDKDLDLALIRVSADSAIPVELDFSTDFRAGEQVIAIGNPLGLENTVSDGLISAIRRIGEDIEFIQTTVPISPGSSGGPLLNSEGKVIGVTTATLGEGQNVNFAIGAKTLRKFLAKPYKVAFLQRAGSKVWFRWILKKILNAVGWLLAIFFGGAGWIVLIIIFGVVLVYKALRALFKVTLSPFKRKKKQTIYQPAMFSSSEGLPSDVLLKEWPERDLVEEDAAEAYEEPEGAGSKQSVANERELTFYCWKCGTLLSVTSTSAGQRAKCPSCNVSLVVPDQ